jgi:hypothetical protein
MITGKYAFVHNFIYFYLKLLDRRNLPIFHACGGISSSPIILNAIIHRSHIIHPHALLLFSRHKSQTLSHVDPRTQIGRLCLAYPSISFHQHEKLLFAFPMLRSLHFTQQSWVGHTKGHQ